MGKRKYRPYNYLVKPKTRADIAREIQRTQRDDKVYDGMKISQVITLAAMHEAWELSAEDVKEFYGFYTKFLQAYVDGTITSEDILDCVDDIKEWYGIDVLEPVVVKDEREDEDRTD